MSHVAVFLMIAIPSIRRVNGHTYLLKTIHSVIDSMTQSERSEVKVVVFLADLDPTYNNRTAEAILRQYEAEVHSGLLTILRVLPEYYPPLVGLRRNFGDSVSNRPSSFLFLLQFTCILRARQKCDNLLLVTLRKMR